MSEETTNIYISLAEATKYCNYSLPYLNLRIRQGKLRAVKFGRNWMTTRKWLGEYMLNIEKRREDTDTFVSLSEATKYCNYSLPYLNLRIRQGKLRAVKFGRNWMTRKEWLEDYLERVERYNQVNRAEEAKKIEFASVDKKAGSAAEEKKSFDISFDNEIKEFPRIKKFGLSKTAYSILLIVFVLIAGSALLIKFGAGDAAKNFSGKTAGIVNEFRRTFDFLKQRFASLKDSGKQNLKGLVTIPSSSKDDDKKKDIQTSFSDEVRVEPVDLSSGYIVPIFREKEGDKFMYIMVPVN